MRVTRAVCCWRNVLVEITDARRHYAEELRNLCRGVHAVRDELRRSSEARLEPPGPPTQQFLEQFRADDGAVFGVVCDSARPMLTRWLRAHGAPHDSIDDILQAAFLSAWVKRHTFGGRGSVVGWLLRIARSEGKQLRRCEHKSDSASTVDWHASAYADDLVDDIRTFLDAGGDERLDDVLRSLTPRQRDAVTLYYYHNYSAREIGDALKCGENGAKSLLHRSRQRIKRALAPALTP